MKIDKFSPANSTPSAERTSSTPRAPAPAAVKNAAAGTGFDGAPRRPRRVNLSGAGRRVDPSMLAEMISTSRAARGQGSGSLDPSAAATAVSREVAEAPGGQDPLRRLVDQHWLNPGALEGILSGQARPGPLSTADQARLGRLLVEKHLAADGGHTLARFGEMGRYPNVARSVGRAFDAGALTDAHLTQLLDPRRGGPLSRRGYDFNGIASLVAASGSQALQSATATRSWDVAARLLPDRHAAMEFQTAAMRATGGSPQATQALLQRAGPEALSAAVDSVAHSSSHFPVNPGNNRYASGLGSLMTGLSQLPSSQSTNAVGARVVGHLTEGHLDSPVLRQGFFDYLRSARSSQSWRGLGPASGIGFTERELLTKFRDPAIRNHMVTEQYYRVSQATEDLLPGHANWATFAVWASRQAGSAIRGEPLMGLSGWNADVARSLSHGNTLVASEIAPLFGAFAQTLRANPSASFQDVWRAGGAPNAPLLREAFQNYHEAYQLRRSGGSADAIAEKMLVANALVGQHEQAALQGDIDSSMRVLGLPLARLMAGTLDLELPGRTLHLNHDLTGQFPPELRTLSNPRARQFEQRFGGPRGSGTRNWPDYQQRMEYIFNLFRLNQRDTALFGEWIR